MRNNPRIKGNVLNLLPCKECTIVPHVAETVDAMSGDAECSITCFGCNKQLTYEGMPLNQLVDIWNMENR